MAILSDIRCRSCGELKTVSHSASSMAPSVCDQCLVESAQMAREKHLSDRAAKTIEQRLALIEADIYDMRETITKARAWDGRIG